MHTYMRMTSNENVCVYVCAVHTHVPVKHIDLFRDISYAYTYISPPHTRMCTYMYNGTYVAFVRYVCVNTVQQRSPSTSIIQNLLVACSYISNYRKITFQINVIYTRAREKNI